VFPRKRASRFIIRCTTPAIGFVLPVKASAEGFDTFTFRVVPSRLLFRHALILPRLSRLKVILRPQRLAALIEKRKMPQRRIRSLAQFLHRLRPLLRVKAITQKIASLY
jgi:hypothetical protein